MDVRDGVGRPATAGGLAAGRRSSRVRRRMFRLARRRYRADDAPATAGSHVASVLRASGLFDPEYYREANPDVAATGMDPVDHYAATGDREARNPNPYFDSAWYLDANPDVREAGVNPLVHYVQGGADEGRSAGPDFDTAYYLAQNPEVGSSGMNPLLHYILHGRDEGRSAIPYDEGDAFEVGVRARLQGVTGPAAALFTGARGDHVHFPLTGRDEAATPDGLPLPPLRLAQRIGSVTLEDFDESGRGIRDAIVRVLPKGWSWEGKRCLDFGSGVGRALRHFAHEAEQAEFWGCDIDGSSIRWSVQNLSPPFRFFQIGEVPTLPFEDSSFDLVYAVSVLSHIHTTWHQWLMEIRRVLKPGGTFFVSFLGPTPMGEMLGEPYWGRGGDFGMYVKGPHQNWNDGGPMIFVSPEWIKSFWGSIFDIDYIAIDGLVEYQSFAVMRKPSLGAPIRRQVPVLKLSTQQAFDPDAVGRIHPQIDPAQPYRQSYGLDLSAQRDTVVEGWVAFRGDVAEGADALVDGRAVPSTASVTPGCQHRDWGSPVTNFTLKLDLSALARGIHRLEVRLRSRDGRAHGLSIPLLIR